MKPQITVKEANLSDRMALWDWYHEPVRGAVFPKRRSESFERHRSWYAALLKRKDVLLCVGLIDILRFGLVRFDEDAQKGSFRAKIYLKPTYCRRGLAPDFLREAIRLLRSERKATKVSLVVPRATSASSAVFEREGMKLFPHSETELYWEELYVNAGASR